LEQSEAQLRAQANRLRRADLTARGDDFLPASRLDAWFLLKVGGLAGRNARWRPDAAGRGITAT
jgi:hypothetical protein